MKLYCYGIPPIDFWSGALTGRQLLESAVDLAEEWESISAFCKSIADLKARAEAAFKTISWEGDVREGPYFFALPGENELSIGYIIKQDNNGNCFVASPEPLAWLESRAFHKTVTDK